eukprot:7516681-Lingulodinium_polyedra.AAC.1
MLGDVLDDVVAVGDEVEHPPARPAGKLPGDGDEAVDESQELRAVVGLALPGHAAPAGQRGRPALGGGR